MVCCRKISHDDMDTTFILLKLSGVLCFITAVGWAYK